MRTRQTVITANAIRDELYDIQKMCVLELDFAGRCFQPMAQEPMTQEPMPSQEPLAQEPTNVYYP